MDHDDVRETLGAWALGACDYDEAAAVVAHLSGCAECRAETASLGAAVDLVGAAGPVPPPDGLRSRTLDVALAIPTPAHERIGGTLTGYRNQVAGLAALLSRLDPTRWSLPIPKHGSVRQLVAHLADNDRLLLDALAIDDEQPRQRPEPADAAQWRPQADSLVRRFATASGLLLGRQVPLAGPGQLRRPARDALVQRVFETWIHADDIRSALDLPGRPPDGDDLTRIIDFGIGLLPVALTRTRSDRPGRAASLVLLGPGSGQWTVRLGPAPAVDPGQPVCVIVASTVDFCRLMAGRLPPHKLECALVGDPAVAVEVLRAASTLGCD